MPAMGQHEAQLRHQVGVVVGAQQDAGRLGRRDRAGAGEREHVGLVTSPPLRLRQVVHVQLDAAASGKVGVRHMEDPHGHPLSSHAAPAGRVWSSVRAPRADATVASTLVAFHAHPDDESLLTGGTLARCAAQGHRVVLVVATSGERGLAHEMADLGERRVRELERAAGRLGVSRIVQLGYGDSGFREPAGPPPHSFCAVPVAEAAARLTDVLREESADVLTVYDDNGGYGHRDHLRVREVGLVAAAQAGTPTVLAATVDRDALLRAMRLLRKIGVRPGGMTPDLLHTSFTASADITHEVDVRPWVGVKRAALRAHASQAGGGDDLRTVQLLARLPWPLSSVVLGREWVVEIGPPPAARRVPDPFGSAGDRLGSRA